MRTRNAIERLAAAGGALLADADSLVDSAEEEQIFSQIVAAGRSIAPRRRPVALALVAVAILSAGGIVAWAVVSRVVAPAAKTGAGRRIALTGTDIRLAGYHFKTPAGFATSDAPCDPQALADNPTSNGFASAASADGGCVEALFGMEPVAGEPFPIPPGASPVEVGSYQGSFVDQGAGRASLYVQLDVTASGGQSLYLVLLGQDLTEAELVAVAQSGLGDIPFVPVPTTGTEGSG